MPRRSSGDYIPFNPEVEHSFHRRKNFYRRLRDSSGVSILLEPTSDSGESTSSAEQSQEMTRMNHGNQTPPTPPPPPPRSRGLCEYSQPSLAVLPQVITPSDLDGVDFEIKPQFITMIERKQFGGTKSEAQQSLSGFLPIL